MLVENKILIALVIRSLFAPLSLLEVLIDDKAYLVSYVLDEIDVEVALVGNASKVFSGSRCSLSL